MLGTTGIESAKPNWPVTRLAEVALREHLLAVWARLQSACDDWRNDYEHIHQLRVATRRASTSIDVFGHLLPRARRQWMARRLRRLRRRAGTARDLDVLVQRMRADEETGGTDRQSTVADLHSCLNKLRRKIQKPLSKEYRRLKKKRFKHKASELVDRIRWRSDHRERNVMEAARVVLRPEMARFVRASREDLTQPRELHQLRLQGKRLRYAIELFSGAFDYANREAVSSVFTELQRRLGDINDHATALSWYQRCRAEMAEDSDHERFEELAEKERGEMDRLIEEFHQWWTAERTAELKLRFQSLLE
jgi:CHAD domain-containing protein